MPPSKVVEKKKLVIRIRQPDGSFKVFTKLPLCQDCKERPVTALGMKYCEPCK